MGIVYRAERVGIGRPVVVKFLHAVLTDQPGIVDRFEREARATARLNHPNCVQLVDYGIEDGAPYLVMEYVEGRRSPTCSTTARCRRAARSTSRARCSRASRTRTSAASSTAISSPPTS